MKKLVGAVSLLLPVTSLVALLLIFSLTNPIDIGPLGVLTVFGLMYLFWASSLFLLLHGGVTIAERLAGEARLRRIRNWRVGVYKAYYIASVAAFGPVMLLALNSVGQLNIQDVILVVALLGLAVFYVIKRA